MGQNTLQSCMEQIFVLVTLTGILRMAVMEKSQLCQSQGEFCNLNVCDLTLRLTVDRPPSDIYHKRIQHAILQHYFEWLLSQQKCKVLHYWYLWVTWDHATDANRSSVGAKHCSSPCLQYKSLCLWINQFRSIWPQKSLYTMATSYFHHAFQPRISKYFSVIMNWHQYLWSIIIKDKWKKLRQHFAVTPNSE